MYITCGAISNTTSVYNIKSIAKMKAMLYAFFSDQHDGTTQAVLTKVSNGSFTLYGDPKLTPNRSKVSLAGTQHQQECYYYFLYTNNKYIIC